MPTLLGDFGHHLPTQAPPTRPVREARVFGALVSARGPRRRGAGWAPTTAPLARYRMTSDQTPVLWPFIAAPGLPPTGALIGIDELSGGGFYADPIGWVLAEDIPVTNPNVFVYGKPGRGKSGTIKAFTTRMLAYGYRTLVLGDTKDEYEPLCQALGVTPFRIGPGLPGRVNPLDLGPLGHGWDALTAQQCQHRAAMIFARWLVLIRALVGSQRLGEHPVPFGPSDEVAVAAILHQLTGYTAGNTVLAPVTIPDLWAALNEPTDDLVSTCRYRHRAHFLDATRLLRDALGQLVHGHLAGMFDTATSITIDWTAPIASLSLRSLAPLGDEAVGIALTCLNSWGRAQREITAPGDRRIVIRDETWKQLRLGAEAVKSLDADLRLSRSDGDIQVVISHKPSDALSAGDAGTQTARIAKDLLHLADIKVLHGQDKAVTDELADLLGLAPMAQHAITTWAMADKGRALWLVGDRPYKVHTIRHPLDYPLTDTNQALTTAQDRP